MGLFDFFNPPAANVPTPQINTYQPTGFGQAESGALGGIGNLGNFNAYASLYPQYSGIGQGLVNDPNAQAFQQGAGTAGALGQNAALGAYGAGAGLMGQGGNLFGLGNQVANTAFDPQNALYNRTLQQTQDQVRAGEAARGIATTPYGAGLENQALNNFNIDWQNQQLQRQIAGGQAASGLYGQGGGLVGQGAGLQAGAPGAYLQASGMPYATSQGIGSGQLGTLGQLGQFGAAGAQIPQQQVQDYLSYLGWGSGQQGMGNQAQLGLGKFNLDQANQGFNQQQTMFGDIGKLAGAGLSFLPGGNFLSGIFGGGAGKGIG